MLANESANERRRKLMNLVRGAALAATLVPLAASVAEAGPITCGNLGPSGEGVGSGDRCSKKDTHAKPEAVPTSRVRVRLARPTCSMAGPSQTRLRSTGLQNMTVFITAFFVDPANPGGFLDRFQAPYSIPAYAPERFLTTFGERWIYFRVEDLQDERDSPPTRGRDFLGTFPGHRPFNGMAWQQLMGASATCSMTPAIVRTITSSTPSPNSSRCPVHSIQNLVASLQFRLTRVALIPSSKAPIRSSAVALKIFRTRQS